MTTSPGGEPPAARAPEPPEPGPPPALSPPLRFGPGIDLFRAVVCVSVVAAHAGPDWLVNHGVVRPGVECFLLLSGFFLAHTFRPPEGGRLSVPRFLARRILRLAAPYWVAVGLFTAYTAASLLYRGRPVSWAYAGETLARLLFISDLVGFDRPVGGVNIFWSVTSLFQYYLAWATLFWAARQAFLAAGYPDYHRRTLGVMTVAAAAAFAGSGVGLLTGQVHPMQGPLHGWMLPAALLYLAAGTLVYEVARRALHAATFIGLLASLVAIGLVRPDPRPLWAAGAGAVLFGLARGGPAGLPGLGWLARVGIRSFSIYLIHPLVLVGLEMVSRRLGPSAEAALAGFWGLAAGVALSVTGGFLFFELVESPFAGLARRIRYRY